MHMKTPLKKSKIHAVFKSLTTPAALHAILDVYNKIRPSNHYCRPSAHRTPTDPHSPTSQKYTIKKLEHNDLNSCRKQDAHKKILGMHCIIGMMKISDNISRLI